MTPLLVYGPRSTTYDFGPGHPLTPRRFGPSLDLLATLGAEPGLAPAPVPDEELLACHSRAYVDVVRAFSERPWGTPAAGIGDGDDPAFAGMHEAAATVAGGSLAAMDAILSGMVAHAFHPGGGLHHAMRDRASGFCIYNDPALAIARARAAGLRVLYLDFDVHHGDGVQALHFGDPGVMTVSIHESGRSLFPGTGFLDEVGQGTAAGTKVNVPLQPYTSGPAWLAALEAIVPELAASFGPDVVVSQHGADSHAWDPLAHIANTTTSMGAAARLVDAVAHRWAAGRWLSTGGGGYDAYRVVPRSWSLVWLAAAHREVPARISPEWRTRWAAEAERYGQAPLPEHFEDDAGVGTGRTGSQAAADRAAGEVAALVRELFVPALVRAASDLGWWRANDEVHHVRADEVATRATAAVDRRGEVSLAPAAAGQAGSLVSAGAAADESPTLLRSVDAITWARLAVSPRVAPPADAADVHALILAALRDGRGSPIVSAAVVGSEVVGLVLSAVAPRLGAPPGPEVRQLLTVGVAPAFRGQGLGGVLLVSHLDALAEAGLGDAPVEARMTLAERDVVAPLDRPTRAEVARRILAGAGFTIVEMDRRHDIERRVAHVDPLAVVARLERRARSG